MGKGKTYPVAFATVTVVMLCGITDAVALARIVELSALSVDDLKHFQVSINHSTS